MTAMLAVESTGGFKLPAEVKRAIWGDQMVDAQLWQPVVRDICAAVGLPMADEAAAGYPGSSAVFAVNRQAVIKLFPPFFARDFVVEI
mgnify:FL=1